MSDSRVITTSYSKAVSTKDSSAAIYVTLPVIVKFIQVIVGVVCIGIATRDFLENFEDLTARSASVITGHELRWFTRFVQNTLRPVWNIDHVFIDQMTCRIVFLAVSIIFLIISLIQLTWFPASLFSGQIKSRIISGVIYHLVGFGLHLAASLFLVQRIDRLGNKFYNFEMMRTVANIGFANGALYLLSAILALCSFVGNNIFVKKSPSSFEKHRLNYM